MNITYEFVHTSNTGIPMLLIKVDTSSMGATEIRDALEYVRETNALYQLYSAQGDAVVIPTGLPTNVSVALQVLKETTEREARAEAKRAADEAKMQQKEDTKIHTARDVSAQDTDRKVFTLELDVAPNELDILLERIKQEFATRGR